MISTKGAARFHSNGFAPTALAATAPNPNNNAIHGTKRLASCREELERSWAATTAHQDSLHCVSSDGGFISEDNLECHSRVKRRRTTLHHSNDNSIDDDDVMDCCSTTAFVKGTRIMPNNRPHASATKKSHQVVVKAGWYEGEVDALGNRHGKGITKHDDGTEYEGPYVADVMEGPNGHYRFATTRHLVPDPNQNGSNLHRQIEKSFKGGFKADMPHGAGTIITKTVDCVPLVVGSMPTWGGPKPNCAPHVLGLGSMPVGIRFKEVVHDICMHNNDLDGKAVGEGVRIIYSTTNVGGRSTLENTCYRLNGGENTNMKVAPSYAKWILQCMGVAFPDPSSTM